MYRAFFMCVIQGFKVLQVFNKKIEYKNIEHCFTLKPLDFASNATYDEKKLEVEKGLKALSEEFLRKQ